MDNILPPKSRLICHAASPAAGVKHAFADISLAMDGFMTVRYRFKCTDGAIVLGPPADAERKDELWKNTCFEVFLKIDPAPQENIGGERDEQEREYIELNFAPSGQWAAYHFREYRTAMAPLDIGPPRISGRNDDGFFLLEASVILPHGWQGKPLRAGISAVIAETDGTKSYWALKHNRDIPDFHDHACFTLQLLPAEAI